MNPNFNNEADGQTDPGTDTGNDTGEGELTFSNQDYPELDGLKAGAPVEIKCQGTVKDSSNGLTTLSIDPESCEFQTQGPADKAMNEMSKQDSMPAPTGDSGNDF